MPIVRLSGRVRGTRDETRALRADLFHLLFERGWDLYNANGDQDVHLDNIQEKIREADAFVFTPQPDLADLFKAASVFVGYQTQDPEMHGKPTALFNPEESWAPFLGLLDHLHRMGTIRQTVSDYLADAKAPEDVLAHISGGWSIPPVVAHVDADEVDHASPDIDDVRVPAPDNLRYNVCVFCSASIRDKGPREDGYLLGKELAENRLGCVSGAGSTGIMGEVVRGCHEAGGWSAGSNVPHIIEMEGLPKGLNMFWPRPDIYTRMAIMIEESDAFVILPGGCGTLQELLALMLRRERGDPTMKGKPIVVYDRKMSKHRDRFWTPLFEMVGDPAEIDGLEVATKRDQILPLLEEAREALLATEPSVAGAKLKGARRD